MIKKLIDYYKAGSKDELYHKIGIGLIDLSDLETALKTNVRSAMCRCGRKLLTRYATQALLTNNKTTNSEKTSPKALRHSL